MLASPGHQQRDFLLEAIDFFFAHLLAINFSVVGRSDLKAVTSFECENELIVV